VVALSRLLLQLAEVETMLARLGSAVAGHAFVDCRHLQDSLRELEAELAELALRLRHHDGG
jgi:hypothetical protein